MGAHFSGTREKSAFSLLALALSLTHTDVNTLFSPLFFIYLCHPIPSHANDAHHCVVVCWSIAS